MKSIIFVCALTAALTGCAQPATKGGCDTTATFLQTPDTKSLMGFSLTDALSPHSLLTIPLTWEPIVPSDGVDYVPNGTTSKINLDLAYTGDPIYENIVSGMSGTHEPANDDSCVSNITTGLSLKVTSDDGALNENIHVQAMTHGLDHLEVIGWLDLTQLKGTFTVKKATAPAEALFVALTVSGLNTYGAISITSKPTAGPTDVPSGNTLVQSGLDLGWRVAGWHN